MTDRLREAAQAALDALEQCGDWTIAGLRREAIWKLRAALAEQEAERVSAENTSSECVEKPAEKEHDALAEQEAETVAYRATSITGDTAHFGVASAARAWARGGTVEAVPLKHLRLVPKHSECGPDCRDCGMLCKQGADIDQRFAGRLAVALECMTFDPMGFWESSTRLLSEYKAEWEKVNPGPATFMGEPIAGNRERLLKAKADRAKISQKSRADYSDCHGPDWTDRDGEYLK